MILQLKGERERKKHTERSRNNIFLPNNYAIPLIES